MRKTYALLKKCIPIITVCLVPILLFGILSFAFCYNYETYSLKIPAVVTCIFLVFVVALIAFCAYVSIKSNGVKVMGIKKDHGFLKFAAYLSSVTMLVGFIYDFASIVQHPSLFGVFRVIKFILSIFVCAYFIISVFPKKIKRTKIIIPRWIKYTLSVCTVLWGIAGIFTVYFLDGLLTSEISRISQVLLYVLITLFFLFEAEVDHLTPKYRAYIFSAFALDVLVCAFPLPMLLIPSVQRFSVMELLYPISIGIYAFARIIALMSTMKRAIKIREDKEASEYYDYDEITSASKAQEGNTDENK